jgi:hypothetical protein
MNRAPSKLSLRYRFKRLSKKVLFKYIRFARRHHNSHRLPLFLFLFLFLDGFVMVVPSILLLIASVTISPARWFLFGSIFALAGTLNNTVVYFICRWISPDTLVHLIEKFQLENLWQSAERALHHYGSYAAFVGTIIGLPVQMIMAAIGIADEQLLSVDPTASSTFVKTILFAATGHVIKGIAVAGLTRFGWVKLESKIGIPEPRSTFR